jgi:hypothetical protein
MTSLRELKKDINYLCSEFVGDCYLILHLHPGSEEKIDALADKVIDSRNELINIIHHPENKHQRNINKDKAALKLRKKQQRDAINKAFDEFIKLIDSSYEALNKFSK